MYWTRVTRAYLLILEVHVFGALLVRHNVRVVASATLWTHHEGHAAWQTHLPLRVKADIVQARGIKRGQPGANGHILASTLAHPTGAHRANLAQVPGEQLVVACNVIHKRRAKDVSAAIGVRQVQVAQVPVLRTWCAAVHCDDIRTYRLAPLTRGLHVGAAVKVAPVETTQCVMRGNGSGARQTGRSPLSAAP